METNEEKLVRLSQEHVDEEVMGAIIALGSYEVHIEHVVTLKGRDGQGRKATLDSLERLEKRGQIAIGAVSQEISMRIPATRIACTNELTWEPSSTTTEDLIATVAHDKTAKLDLDAAVAELDRRCGEGTAKSYLPIGRRL